MSDILIATLPLAGHTRPALPLARALLAAGHRVRWYCGTAFADEIEAVGATFLACPTDVDIDLATIEAREPLPGVEGVRRDLLTVFLDPVPAHVRALTEIVMPRRPDVIVNDSTFVAAALVAEREGIPSVPFSVSALMSSSVDAAPFGAGLPPAPGLPGRLRNRALNLLTRAVLFREPQRRAAQLRRDLGLPALPGFFFDWLALTADRFLLTTVPGFEYPRRDLPAAVEFVGPFLPSAAEDQRTPQWWPDLAAARAAGRPVVVVTQGTLATDSDNLLRPTIRALAGRDVLVVATTGGPDPDDVLPTVRRPANLRIERYVPFSDLLPSADLLVTNGGYGGVQFALANGVPVIGAGTTEDKVEVNARIAWSGAGIDLKSDRPAEEGIAAAVDRVLADSRYRAAAGRLREEYARYDGVRAAVRIVAEVAAAGRDRTPSARAIGGVPG